MQKANAAKGDNVKLKILKILQQIKGEMKACIQYDDGNGGGKQKGNE